MSLKPKKKKKYKYYAQMRDDYKNVNRRAWHVLASQESGNIYTYKDFIGVSSLLIDEIIKYLFTKRSFPIHNFGNIVLGTKQPFKHFNYVTHQIEMTTASNNLKFKIDDPILQELIQNIDWEKTAKEN